MTARKFCNKKLLGLAMLNISLATTSGIIDANHFCRLVENFSLQVKPYQGQTIAISMKQDPLALALLFSALGKDINVLLLSSDYPAELAEAIYSSCGIESVLSIQDNKLITSSTRVATGHSKPTDKGLILLATSGTTGQPKIVKHTIFSLYKSASGKRVKGFSNMYSAYPFSSFAGIQVLIESMWQQKILLLPADFSPASYEQLSQIYHIECICGTPTYMKQIAASLKAPQRTVKQITLGGEIVDSRTLQALKEKFPKSRLSHIYASTEAGVAIRVSDGRAGFSADLLKSGKFRLINSILHVKISSRSMLGYIALPKNECNEWINTGDKVVVENDRVIFIGRENSVINVGGNKVNPVLVERTISNMTEVLDVLVLPKSSPVMGNIVTAKIQLKISTVDLNIMRRKIIQHCANSLSAYMIPRVIKFVDSMPRSNNQKKLRF